MLEICYFIRLGGIQTHVQASVRNYGQFCPCRIPLRKLTSPISSQPIRSEPPGRRSHQEQSSLARPLPLCARPLARSSLRLLLILPLFYKAAPRSLHRSPGWGSQGRATSATSSIGYIDVHQLPLLDCPDCGKPVIRLQSKKARSYGNYFFKCSDNDKVI